MGDDFSSGAEASAALAHRLRNQIQSMKSLASVMARQSSTRETQFAFAALRARFEAATAVDAEAFCRTDDIVLDRMLRGLIERMAELFDPDRQRTVEIRLAPLLASPQRASALAAIMVEFFVALAGSDTTGALGLLIEAEPSNGSGIQIRAGFVPPADKPLPVMSQLGAALVDSLAKGLGAELQVPDDGRAGWTLIAPLDSQRR